MTDGSQQPRVDDILFRLNQVRRAFSLRPDLHDSPVLAGRVDHRLALEDIDADWFLDIHIGSRLDGRDGLQRVPVVRRADQHDVQVALRQHLAIIVVDARLGP